MGPENQLRHASLLADNEGGESFGMLSFPDLELDLLRGKKWNPVFRKPGQEPQQHVICIPVIVSTKKRQQIPSAGMMKTSQHIYS